jgi:hypothetical protein
MSQAAMLNATEVYFTVEAKDELKRKALEDLDFGEVDAGVYYVRDARDGVDRNRLTVD